MPTVEEQFNKFCSLQTQQTAQLSEIVLSVNDIFEEMADKFGAEVLEMDSPALKKILAIYEDAIKTQEEITEITQEMLFEKAPKNKKAKYKH